MKLEYLFYGIGIFFLFYTVAYFAYNYLFDLSDFLKTVMLVLSVIIFFILGEVMSDKDL
ncbi:MAG: hypothetical protein WC867_01180 [Candidatus Pacearchaeota archaeon]|jgi:hypothetical protein